MEVLRPYAARLGVLVAAVASVATSRVEPLWELDDRITFPGRDDPRPRLGHDESELAYHFHVEASQPFELDLDVGLAWLPAGGPNDAKVLVTLADDAGETLAEWEVSRIDTSYSTIGTTLQDQCDTGPSCEVGYLLRLTWTSGSEDEAAWPDFSVEARISGDEGDDPPADAFVDVDLD